MVPIRRPPELRLRDLHHRPRVRCFFQKPLMATPTAIEAFGVSEIVACHKQLQELAVECGGIDYLQFFDDRADRRQTWLEFIEDVDAVTAFLPGERLAPRE